MILYLLPPKFYSLEQTLKVIHHLVYNPHCHSSCPLTRHRCSSTVMWHVFFFTYSKMPSSSLEPPTNGIREILTGEVIFTLNLESWLEYWQVEAKPGGRRWTPKKNRYEKGVRAQQMLQKHQENWSGHLTKKLGHH